MWSDKESKIDFLNFNETAESIKDLITEKELMHLYIFLFISFQRCFGKFKNRGFSKDTMTLKQRY